MSKQTTRHLGRRRALALIGGGTVALSYLGLAGCGGDEPAPEPELVPPEPEAEPTPPTSQAEAEAEAEATAPEPEPAADDMDSGGDSASDAGAGSMTKLDENSAQAKQLAYVHDASTIDGSSQPRYAEGQKCANCALYQGGDSAWGGCPLFQGKLVKRTGWCNGYAPAG